MVALSIQRACRAGSARAAEEMGCRSVARESLALAIGLGVGACAPSAAFAAEAVEAGEIAECAGEAKRPPLRLGRRHRPARNPYRLARRHPLSGPSDRPVRADRARERAQMGMGAAHPGRLQPCRSRPRLVAWAEEHHLAMPRPYPGHWHHPNWFPAWVAGYDFGPEPRARAEQMIPRPRRHDLPPLRHADPQL